MDTVKVSKNYFFGILDVGQMASLIKTSATSQPTIRYLTPKTIYGSVPKAKFVTREPWLCAKILQ